MEIETSKIQALVFSFMDNIGISRVQIEPGVWTANVPEAERTFFNGYECLRFTFDRDIAEKRRDLELICSGSYLLRKIIERLVELPKVSRLFGVAKPENLSVAAQPGELRLLGHDKVYYRQQVLFHFRVSIIGEHRTERLYSILADPAKSELELFEGLKSVDMANFLETPDSSIPINESGEDLVRLYLKACRTLETSLESYIHAMQVEADAAFKEDLQKVRVYLDEQKEELRRKRENVSFHLYFFQKEEEIDKMIRELESEQTRKIEELKEKHTLKVEVGLIDAIILCIPTVGSQKQSTKQKLICDMISDNIDPLDRIEGRCAL